jgi:peptidoglycan/xylan/chitin deacetylase (PgdA/CDA1 family)
MDAPSRVRVSGIAGPGAPTVSDDASSSSQLWDVALGVIRSTLAWAHRVRVRWSAARIGLVFCYHGVSARGGDPVREISAPVSHRDFERQLRHLRRRYRVVPALCLPAEAAARARGRRVPVAITFDDDLPSHLSHAAPALRRAKLPATFFLSGAGLNGPFSFWWQLLQRAWDGDLVDARLLHAWGIRDRNVSLREVARRLEAMPPAERDTAASSLRAAVGGDDPGDTLSREGVEALAAAGFEIGFHTRNHDDLLGLRDEELPVALSAGRAELERIAGPLSTISYPHGRADDRVAAAARAAGFRFGFVADGSPVMLGDDPHLLGRRYPARGAGGRFALDVASTLSAARPNPFSRRPRNRLSPR